MTSEQRYIAAGRPLLGGGWEHVAPNDMGPRYYRQALEIDRFLLRMNQHLWMDGEDVHKIMKALARGRGGVVAVLPSPPTIRGVRRGVDILLDQFDEHPSVYGIANWSGGLYNKGDDATGEAEVRAEVWPKIKHHRLVATLLHMEDHWLSTIFDRKSIQSTSILNGDQLGL